MNAKHLFVRSEACCFASRTVPQFAGAIALIVSITVFALWGQFAYHVICNPNCAGISWLFGVQNVQSCLAEIEQQYEVDGTSVVQKNKLISLNINNMEQQGHSGCQGLLCIEAGSLKSGLLWGFVIFEI